MRKQVLLTLLLCAILCCVTAIRSVHAQPPRGAAPGGGFGRPMTPPGPPAPVPPEVTMPRPTSDEITKINEALKKFVETSPDKDLLKKYESLLEVQAPRDNPCIRPSAGIRGMRHNAFVETARNGDFDILFYGDSITDLWNVEADPQGNPGGKRVFNKYFGDMKVANFGVSGDTTRASSGACRMERGRVTSPRRLCS